MSENCKITEETIQKIEQIFGFSLYDWQKDYIMGKSEYVAPGRRNGKTFAYILKLLLSDGTKIRYRDLKERYIENDKKKITRYGNAYPSKFSVECLRINDILIQNGFKTRIEV